MSPTDLHAATLVGKRVHKLHPERPEVMAERLRLYPAGCFVLQGDGGIAGYMIAHPWRMWHPPGLDTLLGGLPAAPDTFYIHDVALLPEARGSGAGGAGIRLAVPQAGAAGLACVSLIAVGGTMPFWQHHGFRDATDAAPMPVLRSYGDGARYMVRSIPR